MSKDGPTPEQVEAYARLYGAQAQTAEQATLTTLEILRGQAPDFSAAHIVGVIAGALRFYVQNLTEIPHVPTVRDLNQKFFPIINRAAESLLGKAPKEGANSNG